MTNAEYAWHWQGRTAGMEGSPISACPYDVGTVAHRAWADGWINAEVVRRQRAGTFGRTAEEWAQARAEVLGPEHRPDPCQEVIDNLAELERERKLAELRERAVERTLTAEEIERGLELIRHLGRTSAEVMDEFNRSMHALAEAAMKTFAQVVKDLGPLFEAFQATKATEQARKRAGVPIDMHRALLGLPQLPPLPKLCPRHGEDMRGGLCRRCAREQVRARSRSRR